HTTVAGDVVIIDANTTKVEVLDGVYTFKNGKGDTITSIDTNAKAIAFDDSKSKLGADNVQDAIDNLLSKVGSGAGVTLVDNNDGTITLKSDDNTVLGTVSKGSLTNNNDGTYTYDNGDGTPVTFDTNAKAIAFDNSTNGFTSTNVQEALEELKTKLDGTSDTLVNNNDGTYTHTTVAGDVVIIDANTTKVEVLDGVYTFKNGKGDTITSIDTNAKAIAFDDSKSKLGADNVQDAIDNLLSKVGSGAGVTLVDNNDGTITLKSDDNTVLGTVSKGSLTNNNDGTYTYDNGDGTPVTFDTNAKAIAFDNSTNGFTSTNVQEALEELKTKLDGTSDTLVNNNDGTYTHTTVAGDVVVIDANTTKVEVLDGVYTFKNAKGDTITSIDTNAKAIVFDNSNNGFTSTNVQEALEELKTKLDGTSDTLVNNNDGTYTHTTVAGDVVIIDANTTKVEVLDGVYTFKNGKGDTITSIDTNAKAIAFDDSKSKLGADNVQDAIDNLLSKVGSGAGVTLVDNNDGTITLKSDDNTVLGTVSKGSLTNNNDGTYTYDNGDGTPVTFDTNAKAIAFDNSTNGFTSTNVQEAL
ncbi:beta strand repeat-containing protein, partial [Myroides odoratimimus]|uniref:beta strand repeat-containing protein n=1 Tax=Myroides odoratimimus TaxID=76832 RepID=UPI003D9C4FC0